MFKETGGKLDTLTNESLKPLLSSDKPSFNLLTPLSSLFHVFQRLAKTILFRTIPQVSLHSL